MASRQKRVGDAPRRIQTRHEDGIKKNV